MMRYNSNKSIKSCSPANRAARPMWRFQRGLSLVELMVAVALSAFLMLGVTQIFIANQQSTRLQNSYARVQESGRLAVELIAREIRMADFWGCAGATIAPANNTNLGSSNIKVEFGLLTSGITGQDDGFMSATVPANSPEHATGFNTLLDTSSDTISLSGAGGSGAIHLVEPYMNTAAAAVYLNTTTGLTAGDVVMLSDCSSSADIFMVTQISAGSPGAALFTLNHATGTTINSVNNTDTTLETDYRGDAMILRPRLVEFFVAPSVVNPGGNTSLWMYEHFQGGTGGQSFELVTNVTRLEFTYGRDTTGNNIVDRYDAALSSWGNTEWDQVRTVKIELEITGEEAIDINLNVAGDAAPVSRTYTRVVTVRNRILGV